MPWKFVDLMAPPSIMGVGNVVALVKLNGRKWFLIPLKKKKKTFFNIPVI